MPVFHHLDVRAVLGLGRRFRAGAGAGAARFFGGGRDGASSSSSRRLISSSYALALSLARDAPPTGAIGLRVLAAAVFLVDIKSSLSLSLSLSLSSVSEPPARLAGADGFPRLERPLFPLDFLAARVDHGLVLPLSAHFLLQNVTRRRNTTL